MEDARYKTLAFAPPSIERTTVKGIAIAEPDNKQDAISGVFGRLTFEVRVPETVDLLQVNIIEGSDTSVKMEETDKGYMYTADF